MGLLRKWSELSIAALIVSGSAHAQCPDPDLSTVPAFVRIGGAQTAIGIPDPSIAFTIRLVGSTGAVPGKTVRLDFGACSDLRLCTAVIDGQTIVDCPPDMVVTATTNEVGQATFQILGGSINPGTTAPPAIFPGAELGCVSISVEGCSFATFSKKATAVIYDQNGALFSGNGVDPADQVLLKNDVFAAAMSGDYRGRSDLSENGTLNLVDLVVGRHVLARAIAGIGSGAGCASGGSAQPYCP